jgi:hypothetical protein
MWIEPVYLDGKHRFGVREVDPARSGPVRVLMLRLRQTKPTAKPAELDLGRAIHGAVSRAAPMHEMTKGGRTSTSLLSGYLELPFQPSHRDQSRS